MILEKGGRGGSGVLGLPIGFATSSSCLSFGHTCKHFGGSVEWVLLYGSANMGNGFRGSGLRCLKRLNVR